MDDDLFFAAAAPPRARSLTQRIPAQAVITQLLDLQRATPPRPTPARVFGRSPLSDEAAPWYRGALGELHVGRLLTKLPAGWHVLHAASLTEREQPSTVVVLTSNQLVRWLKKRPTAFASDQVEALLVAASAPATWHASPPASQDTTALRASFAQVDQEVRQARRVRRAWGIGLVGAGGLTALTAGPSLLGALLSKLVG